jgi:hypothetical protein
VILWLKGVESASIKPGWEIEWPGVCCCWCEVDFGCGDGACYFGVGGKGADWWVVVGVD